MTDDASTSGGHGVTPQHVEYDPLTGVPSEFNEYLPHDSAEWKKWKAAQEGPEALEKLTLKDSKTGQEIEKQLPGGKVKTKAKAEIIIQTAVRNKTKNTTSVSGLELFGIKLSEASKLFGKKFACGASVTKNPLGTEQIEMQGDFKDDIPPLIIKNYGTSHKVPKSSIYVVEVDEKKKRKVAFYGGADSEEEEA